MDTLPLSTLHTRQRENWWEWRKAHEKKMVHYHTNGLLIGSFHDLGVDTLITQLTSHFIKPSSLGIRQSQKIEIPKYMKIKVFYDITPC
jgi:hypothetical protein